MPLRPRRRRLRAARGDRLAELLAEALAQLERTEPIGKAFAYERIARLQASMLIDFRNRLVALERAVAILTEPDTPPAARSRHGKRHAVVGARRRGN